MVSHKEFVDAGKTPGLQVWRIENLDLKPVPKKLHGNFYTGDAYLLLFTTSAPSYNIHMWLGKVSVLEKKREKDLLTDPRVFMLLLCHRCVSKTGRLLRYVCFTRQNYI